MIRKLHLAKLAAERNWPAIEDEQTHGPIPKDPRRPPLQYMNARPDTFCGDTFCAVFEDLLSSAGDPSAGVGTPPTAAYKDPKAIFSTHRRERQLIETNGPSIGEY